MSTSEPGKLHVVGRWLVASGLGIVVGGVGTVMHRAISPWGLVVALLVVLSGGVAMRAWSGWGTLGAFGFGWLAIVALMWMWGPGGDVLIPAKGGLGEIWIFGGVVATMLPTIAPRSWFRDDVP